MQLYGDVVLDLAGNAVPGAKVQVLTENGSIAAIFNAAGASVSNPLTTGAIGDFAFQAANGKYLLQISIGARLYRTVGPVSLYDPADARPARLQVIATRGRMPCNVEGAGASNYSRFESTITVRTGPRPVTSLQVAYCNRTAISGGENWTNANDFVLDSAIVYAGQVLPTTFRGSRTPAVGQGTPLMVSDRLGLNVPENTSLVLRSGAAVTAGQKVPVGQPASFLYNGYDSTAATSQVYTSGGMALPAGGAAATLGFVPLAVLGIPDRRHPAALLWGDSITFGVGDTANGETTFGHVGWAERGLVGAAAGGYNVPFVNVSRSGDTTNTWSTIAAAYQGTRWALLEYVTHAVFAMGINDIAAGRTLAQLQANVQAAWASAKRMGVKAYQTTLTPNVTTADAYATVANQTPVANYTTAGIRGQFNAWLPSQVAAGNIDGIIDVNSAVCDPGNPDKWAANGSANYMTADGLHPSTAAHILMAAVLNPAASAWTVS